MKKTNLFKAVIIVITVLYTGIIHAQNSVKPKVTVLNIDTKGVPLDPVQMGNLVRIELEKLGTYEVTDRYDVTYVIEKNKLSIDNCYGKLCLVEIGNIIKSEKMFTGSVELYGETIILTLRMIDVASATIEKTEVKEFLNLPKELQSMVGITINAMYGKESDPNLVSELTKKTNFENAVNTPNVNRLRLDGPRMGFTVFTGETANIIKAKRSEGGFDAIPVMFQFGYQFEKQYLNSGNVQALFEVIPLITGLDQGMFIPSVTLMHGLRLNNSGWEFAFGPTFNVVTTADGTYDGNGKWWTKGDYFDTFKVYPSDVVNRLDSRGTPTLHSQFILAAGKSYKSGKLNVPFNVFFIPNKKGFRAGFSFGFNGKNK